eukprot:CAMPEP_0178681188 /NCGR_PEP_ID=MMETSP0699-20121125/1099_1 /TAXON_ID=265572 /ORGANISM="Extubocellulus spinifer, Strain CCMP396" /LENGTH=774 /DNA_ID=CAMNT_0020325623 /DNA_START=590 /DNA_END=2914 /DNA_ORIENTATION=+
MEPSSAPTRPPSLKPTDGPTAEPSSKPSITPTRQHSSPPSSSPSSMPSKSPSSHPSHPPTVHPTRQPTDGPTSEPTAYHSEVPSVSMSPSNAPTSVPSSSPSNKPSQVPSNSPSSPPTPTPSSDPSAAPSDAPSINPTGQPSLQPSRLPSATPSFVPSSVPTVTSSDMPSSSPTVSSAPTTAAPTHRPSSSMAPSTQPSDDVVFGQDVVGSPRLSSVPDSEASGGSSLSTKNLVIIFIVGLALGAFGFWAVGWYRRKVALHRELDESGSGDDGAKIKDKKAKLANLKAATNQMAKARPSGEKGQDATPGRTTTSVTGAKLTNRASGVETKRPLSPTQRVKEAMDNGKATMAEKRKKRREAKKEKAQHRSTTRPEVTSMRTSGPRRPLSPTQRIKVAMVEGKTELSNKAEQWRKAREEKAQQREPSSFYAAPTSPRVRRANMKLKMSRDHQRSEVTNRAGVKGGDPHVIKKPTATIAKLEQRDDKERNSGRSARRSSNRSEEMRRRLEDLEKRERADIDKITRMRSQLSELEKREKEDYDEVLMMRSILSGGPNVKPPEVKHRTAPTTTTRSRSRPPRPTPQPVPSTGRHTSRSRSTSRPRTRPSSSRPSRRAREQQSILDTTSATTASTRSESRSGSSEASTAAEDRAEAEAAAATAVGAAKTPPQQMMRPITDAQVPLLSNSESTHFSIVYTAEQNRKKKLEHNSRQSFPSASSGSSTARTAHNRDRFDSFPSTSLGSSTARTAHNRDRFDSRSQMSSSGHHGGRERSRPSYR